MTIPQKTHKEQYSKTYSSKMHSSKHRNPKTSVRLALPAFSGSPTLLTVLAVLVFGSALLAASCAPAVEGSGHPSAPAAVTSITEDETKQESDSFTVRWKAPTETGTTQDGTPLELNDIGYRIYYLAETADQTTGQDTPSAESLRQNTDAQTQKVKGVLQARITGLEAETRYFVTVASYNAQPSEPVVETASSEVIIATTGAATPDLNGSLSYGAEAETTHEFTIGVGGTITPDGTPAIPSDGPTSTISYSLEIIDGTVFDPELGINESGVITIALETSAGSARYFVRAKATGYTTQTVMLTITINKANFEGSLIYTQEEHSFTMGLGGSITPDGIPAIPSDGPTSTISYSLERRDGTDFTSEKLTINESGVITIALETSAGSARYFVRAEADGYNIEETTLRIVIVSERMIQMSTYYSRVGETIDVLPIGLGQAIVDDGTFALEDSDVVFTATGLLDKEYTIHFGTVGSGGANEYNGGSYTRPAANGTITVLKSDLTKDPSNSFSFADGAVIGISGLGIIGTQHVAMYHLSNIYGSQDLQAMRLGLTQDYVLKNDIEFPSEDVGTGTVASNYEAVGDEDKPFTGSLDGANESDSDSNSYSITGIQIDSANDEQGIFGVMEAGMAETIAAQNLVLRDFKIKGNTYVGSLAGWLKRGRINNVHVEVSNADAGKIEVSNDGDSYGGGLLGRAGITRGEYSRVKIQNTSSAVAVVGSGASSSQIGGLLGKSDGTILTGVYTTGSVTASGDNVGGLVGFSGGISGLTGYTTGSVEGNDIVGGLVGNLNGNLTGYATGSVVGRDTVGGLVGFSQSGAVRGYMTGSVTAGDKVGGLVGSNGGGSNLKGYATGPVTGSKRVGGLVGYNGGVVGGYARGVVRRNGGTNLQFGKSVGEDRGTSTVVFNSATKSQVYDGETGTVPLADTSGVAGTEVNIASATQTTFSGLSFGTALSQWTWFEDGKWPAINIGDEIKPAAEQPLTSMP